jgi:hypothetical protein
MKKNLLSSIFVFGLILIGLFLLAGCQLETKVVAAAGHESHGPLTHETTINPEVRAFEHYTAEQAAAGKAGIVYAMDPIDLKLFNAAYAAPTTVTADQARWDAVGEFYTSHAGARSAEVITADQARWDAVGEFYTSQAANAVRDLAVVPAVEASEASTDFDYEQAAENMAYRWTAMARAYERHGLLNTETDPADIVAFRWTAMAKAYERNGLLNYKSNPDDVMAFRWLAMAKAYEKLGLLNDQLDPGDVKAFRWNAMAREYERLGLLNSK